MATALLRMINSQADAPERIAGLDLVSVTGAGRVWPEAIETVPRTNRTPA